MACSQAIEDSHDQSGMLALPEHVEGGTQTGRRQIIGTEGGIDEQLVERPNRDGRTPGSTRCDCNFTMRSSASGSRAHMRTRT